MVEEIKSYKLLNLPAKPIKNAVLYILDATKGEVAPYITDLNGVPIPFKSLSGGGVQTVTNADGTITVTGTVSSPIISLSAGMQSLINGALQSGDPISQLLNDAGYITIADVPTFDPSNFDLSQFNNSSGDPYAKVSDIPSTGGLVDSVFGRQGDITQEVGDYDVTQITNAQETLQSGINIKTINNEPLLGSGNITISGGGGGAENDPYDGSWDGNLNAPSKNSVYDKIESLIVAGVDTNIYNTYRVSETLGDLEQAIVNINALNISENKVHVLLIDQNVNITGTPRTITINHPVIVQRGFKFTTPLVNRSTIDETNPIVGTVADNYIQLQFNGKFSADRDLTIFEGDGLIWFGYSSVEEIWANWFGMFEGSSGVVAQNLNNLALQKAVNCVVLDKSKRATSSIRIDRGNYYTSVPIVAFASQLDEHPFLTGRRNAGTVSSTIINLSGITPIKHEVNFGETTNIYYVGTFAAPFMFQGLRNTIIKNLRIEGVNNINDRNSEWQPTYTGGGAETNAKILATIVLRPDNFASGDIEQTAWISRNITWGSSKPYAAIITDPFRIGRDTGQYSLLNTPISTLDLYYGINRISHQNSWDVKIENMHIRKFVEGIVNTLTGQQGDTFVYRNIMFTDMAIGIATCQDQARDCKAYEVMAYGPMWAAFDNKTHGFGINPEVQSFHSAGGLKYIHFGNSGNGILKFDSIYSELIYAFGCSAQGTSVYSGGGISEANKDTRSLSNFSATITNSTVKISGDNQYSTAEGINYLLRPPTIKNININNSLIAPYVSNDRALTVWQPFRLCNFNGAVTGGNSDKRFPIDEGWFDNVPVSTLSRERKVGVSLNISQGFSNQENFNLYNTGGLAIDKNLASGIRTYDPVSYYIEETMYYKKLDSATVTVYSGRGFVELNLVNTNLKKGDLIQLSKSDKTIMGVVETNDSTTVRIVNINLEESIWLDINKNVSNEITGVIVNHICFNTSHAPFLATKTADNKVIELNSYAVFNGNDSSTAPVEVNTTIRMPDGGIYYIESISGTLLTLHRAYTATLNYEWCEPLNPNFKTKSFVSSTANGGRFLYSSYYKKGEKYKYYRTGNVQGEGYVICINSGDFYEARENRETRSTKKADFLRYDDNHQLIEFINGSATIFPISIIVTIPFNLTGTTLQRPDNSGFPIEYIPNGFIYTNTETSEDQIWTGTMFKTI